MDLDSAWHEARTSWAFTSSNIVKVVWCRYDLTLKFSKCGPWITGSLQAPFRWSMERLENKWKILVLNPAQFVFFWWSRLFWSETDLLDRLIRLWSKAYNFHNAVMVHFLPRNLQIKGACLGSLAPVIFIIWCCFWQWFQWKKCIKWSTDTPSNFQVVWSQQKGWEQLT